MSILIDDWLWDSIDLDKNFLFLIARKSVLKEEFWYADMTMICSLKYCIHMGIQTNLSESYFYDMIEIIKRFRSHTSIIEI